MGPLQARSRRRSRADRRGPGYQPPAMGHCRAHYRRVHHRRRRARRRSSEPCSRSATQSGRLSRSRARAPREFDERRCKLERKFHRCKASIFSQGGFHLLVPLREDDPEGSTMCSAIQRGIYPQHPCGRCPTSRSINRLTDAAPGIVDLWNLEERRPARGDRGLARALFGDRQPAPEVKLARRHPGRVKTLIHARHHDRASEVTRRPLRYGDILVLVRRRGEHL